MNRRSIMKKFIKRIVSMILVIAVAVTIMSVLSYIPVQIGSYRWTPLSIGLVIMGLGLIVSAFLYEFRDEASIRDK